MELDLYIRRTDVIKVTNYYSPLYLEGGCYLVECNEKIWRVIILG